MSDEIISSTALYLLPGMKAKIMIPVNVYDNRAMFPTTRKKYKDTKGNEHTLRNGFYVLNTDVGTIDRELTDEEGFGILYWHRKPEANVITYITEDPNIKAECHIISVPIHDHSSIVQGGPAYGTYFSDDG